MAIVILDVVRVAIHLADFFNVFRSQLFCICAAKNRKVDGCAFTLNDDCLRWHQPFRGLSFCFKVEYGFVGRQRDPSDHPG